MGPESQSVPPPQPSQPSSSAAAPLPTSGVADGVEREEQPDLGHQHRADQAPETEPGDGAENPVTGPPDSFDYDTLVASGKPDPAAERAAWERLPPLAAALHHASAAATSGGTPRLGWFADAAIFAAQGRYRCVLDRDELLAGLTQLAAVAGRPKKSRSIVRIALRQNLLKLSVGGTRYEFAAVALALKEDAAGFCPGAPPVAFAMSIRKLIGHVRTINAGMPARFEVNNPRRRLLILDRVLRCAPITVPNQFAQPLLGMPKPVGMLDPLPLAQGLQLLEQVVSKRTGPREYGSWSRAYVRDQMVFGCRNMVLAVLHAPGLGGLEAMVHAANLHPVSEMVRRLDGSYTGNFVTENHSLVTDERNWIGLLTKPDIPFREEALMAYLLRREPSDWVLIPCSELLEDLDSLLEVVKDEPGAGQVRLRVQGVGTDARMSLQVADRPKLNRGVGKLKCTRQCKWDAGKRAADIDIRLDINAFSRLTGYFRKTFPIANFELDVLTPSTALPRPVLRLRYEIKERGGYTTQAFLIGAP